MKTKVLQLLKPKTVSLGFSKEELEGVAADLAGNLQEDATDEAIQSEIDKVLPYLKVSQSMANRVINAEKEKLNKKQEPAPGSDKKPVEQNDEMPAWYKKEKEEQKALIDSLINANQKKDRRASFEATLEGLLPLQKAAKLKDFDRINFKDDEDFNSYVTEQEEVMKGIKQELADKGLEIIGAPGVGGKGDVPDKPSAEVLERVAERNAEQGATAITGLPK